MDATVARCDEALIHLLHIAYLSRNLPAGSLGPCIIYPTLSGLAIHFPSNLRITFLFLQNRSAEWLLAAVLTPAIQLS
jgi:hypothetical protein